MDETCDAIIVSTLVLNMPGLEIKMDICGRKLCMT